MKSRGLIAQWRVDGDLGGDGDIWHGWRCLVLHLVTIAFLDMKMLTHISR